jgi:hypothetical protein
VKDTGWIARIAERSRDRLGQAKPTLELPQHHHAAVRGQQPGIERGCERLARYGRQTGQNGVACMMDGGDPVATRTLCFDTRMLRQTNGFVAVHHPNPNRLMNKTG